MRSLQLFFGYRGATARVSVVRSARDARHRFRYRYEKRREHDEVRDDLRYIEVYSPYVVNGEAFREVFEVSARESHVDERRKYAERYRHYYRYGGIQYSVRFGEKRKQHERRTHERPMHEVGYNPCPEAVDKSFGYDENVYRDKPRKSEHVTVYGA